MLMCLVPLDVFNTEAHPFKVPPTKDRYGSSSVPTPTVPSDPFVINPGPLPLVSVVPPLINITSGFLL